jgi:hypothetical protein
MNLRDNGIITERHYIGQTLEEATRIAKEGGFEVRIVEVDGQAKILPMDAKTNRINFRVRDGFVTAVYGG